MIELSFTLGRLNHAIWHLEAALGRGRIPPYAKTAVLELKEILEYLLREEVRRLGT